MDISKDISLLKETEEKNKLELYKKITNYILDVPSEHSLNMSMKDIEDFSQEITSSLKHSYSNALLEQLELILKDCNTVKRLFTNLQVKNIIEGLSCVIKACEDESTFNLSFSCLTETLILTEPENAMLDDLLGKAAEIICKKTTSVPLCITICNFMQKFCIHCKHKLTRFMQIIPMLIYPPLYHSSKEVREIAEKTFDNFPKLYLYDENEEGSMFLLKWIKESNCKELLLLFKEKHEVYVMKVWNAIVNGLGKTLHKNLPSLTPFFQVIEKGFKSQDDEVCKAAFISWKSLISIFRIDEVLNDSKKLRFVLKPFRNLSKFSELTSFAVCETWWHLAWSLSHNLSSRFDEVLMPLLEFAFGKNAKSQIFLVKRGVHILLRLLEQPQNNSLNRISSPKKLPQLIYPPLEDPVDIKVIVRHSKEVMSMIRVAIETFGSMKDMANHIDCLLKSVLFVLSSVVEDKNKESVEAVISFVNFVTDVIESQLCSPLTCLKCVDSLSKLPRSVLVSHYFHCGPRKQDLLCTSLLRLLMNPYLLTTEISNKRFLMAYNRLVQAGLGESINPLSIAHKLINIVKQVTAENKDTEILFEMWSGIASPLLEAIEKTQEVNQGAGQEHDFSCLYDVLLCPFENIFPVSLNQLRSKPAFRLWTSLFKTFVRCASLVPTTTPNEVCEHFCSRLKNYFKDELLKEPQYFETVCFLLQVVLESIDFSSVVAPSTPVFASPSMLLKKKKPLGNLTSFVKLLSMLLMSFCSNYIENEDDIYQSCTPKAQRKGSISKAAAPLDLVKTFLGSLKTGLVISSALEELSPSLSKLFAISLTKTQIGVKLEALWNTLLSAIEMHYLGPYDTDFLTSMSPLLESCFTHPRRHIKERSRRFWFATFAPVSSSLIIPESLKGVLKKSKLSLMPDEQVSSLEDYSLNLISDSMEDEVINSEKPTDIKDSFAKPLNVKLTSFKFDINEVDSKQAKLKKPSNKRNLDELPSDEFVTINSPASECLTPKRRSFRRRKSFVPAMYNDLSQSQDTTTLGGSSESFDTSSSCEIMEFKTQEESEKLPSSNHELSVNDQNQDKTTSEKEEKARETDSSIEVISSQNSTPSDEKEKSLSQSTSHAEMEITSPDTKRFLENKTNLPETDGNEQGAKTVIGSTDVIVVAIPENVSSQDMVIDSNNSAQEMPESGENADSLPDIKLLKSSCEDKTRLTRGRGRKRNPSGEVLNSLQSSKSNNSSTDSVKNSEFVAEDEGSTVKTGSIEVVFDGENSQKNGNKKIKADVESTNKNPIILKKNRKSKQKGITSYLKKANNNHNKLLPQKTLSESLSDSTSSNKLEGHSLLSKSNETHIELIDLSDSEDIIPSSQSSGDSMSCIKLPVKETSPKNPNTMLTFDPPEDNENKINKVESKSETCLVKDIVCEKGNVFVEGECNECPETPNDLIQPAGDDIVAEVMNQASAFVTKTICSMPLKSSENLVISDELLNKNENKAIKTVLSDVLIKNNEEKKVLIAENKPPLFTEVYTVQTSEPVSLLDKLSVDEEKVKPSLEESPKTVRIKSLRSASKNTARKSFSSSGIKRSPKKFSKRKSMPALNQVERDDKLRIDENMNSGTNSDQLLSSNEIEKISKCSSQPEDEQKYIDECPTSLNADTPDNEQNSVLEDINKVVFEIHEKIQSYNNEGYSSDFNLSEKMEVDQDSDKGSFSSSKNIVYKGDLNEADDHDDIGKIDVVSIDDCDNSEITEIVSSNCSVLSEEQNELDLYPKDVEKDIRNENLEIRDKKSPEKLLTENAVILCTKDSEKSEITNKISEMEDKNSKKSSEINVSILYNKSSSEETVNDKDLKTDIPAADCTTSVQFTENKGIKLSKIEKKCEFSDLGFVANNPTGTQNLKMTADLQLNLDSAIDSSGQSFDMELQEGKIGLNRDEQIGDKNNVDEIAHQNNEMCEMSDEIVQQNDETCEMSDKLADYKTTEDSQIKILDVVSITENCSTVFENLGKESMPGSLIVDPFVSAGEILTSRENLGYNVCQTDNYVNEIKKDAKTLPEAETNSEKSEVSSATEITQIELDGIKIKQNSCSSEIEEIEETCDIVNFATGQHLSKTPERVISEQKNSEVSVNNEVAKNHIEEEHEVIKPEMNDSSITYESSKTINSNKNILEEKEECVNKTFPLKDSESCANGNKITTVIKLTSDSKLPVKPEIGLEVSGPEINNVELNGTGINSLKTLNSSDLSSTKNSNISSTSDSSTNSISQINNKEMVSSSRRRKPKCPVRSPFNFRHLNKIVNSISNTVPKDNVISSEKMASKKSATNIQDKFPGAAISKVKKHIEPKIKIATVTAEHGHMLDTLMDSTNSSHDLPDQEVKKAISSAKRLKVVVNLKEMTDVNTRFNASIAPQTRRLKMLADVHNSQPVKEENFHFNENISTNTENDISTSRSSTSILKKRKAPAEASHSKLRKVTFSDPLVEERLFSNDDNLSERILRVSAQINIVEQENNISSSDVEKVVGTNISSSDEIPSSSEYQNSDNLTDYNHLPISPLLVNCEESINCIIKDLTSPTWAQALMTLLLSKNIKTIGDLCKLNIHELKALPIKSPKVSCLHKTLLAHLQRTQEAAAFKMNSTGDWCTDANSLESKNKENEPHINQEEEKMDESISSEVLESIAGELLAGDRIKLLKRETLLALSKKCFQEVTARLENH